MKTPEQIKQEAEAAFKRGNVYFEKRNYDLSLEDNKKEIVYDPTLKLPTGKCSFCGLPLALTHGLRDLNDKKICDKCFIKPEIIESIKHDNKTLYNKIIVAYKKCSEFKKENNSMDGLLEINNNFFYFGNAQWLTDLTIEDLRIKAREYENPKLPKPILINNIPIHKNQSMELLEGEIFKKHPEKDVEVSNLGRVKQSDCVLEQYDPKNNGYLFVDIKSIRKTISEKVYRLVAETWLERPDLKGLPDVHKSLRYNTVHHISNNGYDNRIENLLWVTEWQHAMIHPWLNIDKFNYGELKSLFDSYADINIIPDDYQRIINIAKRMQQLENAESKFPGKYDYWYENIIEAMEDLNNEYLQCKKPIVRDPSAPLGSLDNPYDLETAEGCKAFIDWLERI